MTSQQYTELLQKIVNQQRGGALLGGSTSGGNYGSALLGGSTSGGTMEEEMYGGAKKGKKKGKKKTVFVEVEVDEADNYHQASMAKAAKAATKAKPKPEKSAKAKATKASRSAAGKARWNNLSEAQKAERIQRMQEGRARTTELKDALFKQTVDKYFEEHGSVPSAETYKKMKADIRDFIKLEKRRMARASKNQRALVRTM